MYETGFRWHRGGMPRKSWITQLVSLNEGREREGKKEVATREKETLLLFLRKRSSRMGPIVNYSAHLEGLSTLFSCSHPSAIPTCATHDLPPFDKIRRRTKSNGNLWCISMVFSLSLSLSLSLAASSAVILRYCCLFCAHFIKRERFIWTRCNCPQPTDYS